MDNKAPKELQLCLLCIFRAQLRRDSSNFYASSTTDIRCSFLNHRVVSSLRKHFYRPLHVFYCVAYHPNRPCSCIVSHTACHPHFSLQKRSCVDKILTGEAEQFVIRILNLARLASSTAAKTAREKNEYQLPANFTCRIFLTFCSNTMHLFSPQWTSQGLSRQINVYCFQDYR